jgi:hypothetical protein
MDDNAPYQPAPRKSDPFQFVYFLIPASFFIGLLFVGSEISFSRVPANVIVIALVAGAGFIWFVVRKLNRRHDPRGHKPPPDAP